MMSNKLLYIFKKRYYRTAEKNDISIEQLHKLVEQGAILLDIRSPQEYEEGHLANSILIPEYELRVKAKEILMDKSQPIIVYCSTGRRSKRAQRTLEKMGYKQVYNLYQGLDNY